LAVRIERANHFFGGGILCCRRAEAKEQAQSDGAYKAEAGIAHRRLPSVIAYRNGSSHVSLLHEAAMQSCDGGHKKPIFFNWLGNARVTSFPVEYI
jgi:hypothetical protein